MSPRLDSLVLEPEQPAVAAVIWMHGLGADAGDFSSVPPELGLAPDLPVRYIFPNAPRIPVTINMGMVMRAWYDVSGFERKQHDEKRIRASSEGIHELVARERGRGIAAGRVVLAGFSQGGAMALFAGLRYPESLAGVVCLSGYLLLDEELESVAQAQEIKPPIFQAHGLGDPMVPYESGRQCGDRLTAAGYDVDWHEYQMGHQVCLEEIRDLGSWLQQVLSPKSEA